MLVKYIKKHIPIALLLLAFSFQTKGQTYITDASPYCNPSNINNYGSFYIDFVKLGDINNTTANNTDNYTFYNSTSTELIIGSSNDASLRITRESWRSKVSIRVWIDFDGDNDFGGTNENVYSVDFTSTEDGKEAQYFTFDVPADATVGTSRMRVAVSDKSSIDDCAYSYAAGEVEDYVIEIVGINEAPVANCIGNLDVGLDVSGNITITTEQIDNGSTDDSGEFTLSLDKSTFTCDDIGINEVILTVTDAKGLTDTCTATVTVSNYSGVFEAPIIEPTTVYCEYSAAAPIMDYQCGQQITGTTSDTTYFDTAGTYTIDWSFDNGSTVVTSTETITIETPVTPTNVSISSITENTANITWGATGSSYKVRYKQTSNSTWIELTSETNSTTLTGLNFGTDYDVQIAIDADCALYTNTENFTTIDIAYCDSDVNLGGNNSYYISQVTFGDIDNTSNNSASNYTYYKDVSTNITPENALSGTINFERGNTSVGIVVWIDYNSDGDFFDENEEVYSVVVPTGVSSIDLPNDILVPLNAVEGKSRMRIGIKQSSVPSSSCNFDYQAGEIEDYDIFINPRDTSSFEAAIITQVYHNSSTDRWIEISNSSEETIDANTLILALFQNATGDQSGVTPSATYTIPVSISSKSSVLIKNASAVLNNYQTSPQTDDNITNFDGGDDILIISTNDDATAWDNRFDVVENITNNTCFVRTDAVNTYNSSYNSNEWVAFVDNSLDPYRDLGSGGPERHPHAPLISEVNNAASGTNILLGTHYFDATSRISNAWSNGNPDRSRSLLINENYATTSLLPGKSLELASSQNLTITDNLLLISDNITLNSGSELRLAGTSQLIQTHTDSENISGTGNLFIDQKSNTASIYRFNYLSSPVNSTGSSSYTVASVLKDGTEATSANSTPLDINFIAGYDGNTGSPISIAEYWIYTYTNGDGGRSSWSRKSSDGAIGQVDGFTLKGPGVAQNYTFVGTPKDGNLTTTVGGYQSYLVGNPYSSAISAKKFIEDNIDAIDGTLYFWEHAGIEDEDSSETAGHNYGGYIGGYGTRNASMGLAANKVTSNDDENPNTPSIGNGTYTEPKEYIAVGQGFFVSSDVDGGTINFNNSQREFIKLGSQSIFFKVGKQQKEASVTPTPSYYNSNLPIIKLGLDYNNGENISMHRQIGISFNQHNSFAFDNGYDSSMFDIGETDMYWQFPNDDNKYIIAGVQEISDDLQIPLVVKMGYSGDISFTIDEWQAIDRIVYIKDNYTGVLYPLNNGKISLYAEEGLYEDRFVLSFSPEGALDIIDPDPMENLLVYFNINTNGIVVKNYKQQITEAALFDVLGNEIHTWSDFSEIENDTLKTPYLKTGVYIIQLKIDGKTISKKIMASNY